MDIRAGNYCCNIDQEPVVYIKDQYSEGSLSSSLVIPTTRQPIESFAEVSKLQVPFRQVVATTACNKANISKVIVITNSIYVAKKIFNTKFHPYQIHTSVILNELRQFFTKCQDNHIEFWEYPSQLRWKLHKFIDKDLKLFKPIPILLNKISWDYCKKVDSDNIIKLWKMTFQASDGKERHFLDLVDDNFKTIELSYTKEGLQLQSFGYSNSLCAQATRAITNHAPIGKYCL